MKIEIDPNDPSTFDFSKNCWAIVQQGVNRYVGRIIGVTDLCNEDLTSKDMVEICGLTAVDIVASLAVEMNPVFEYQVNTAVDPRTGQIGKQPFVVPYDLTTTPVTVALSVDQAFLLRDVAEADQDAIKVLIKLAWKALDEFHQARRVKNAGIIAP
jgi:hypothetical protein